MSRRNGGTILGALWVVALIALAAGVYWSIGSGLSRDLAFHHREGVGFPHMPLYGLVTWWFFLVTPLIGATYGFFNDWRDPQPEQPRDRARSAR